MSPSDQIRAIATELGYTGTQIEDAVLFIRGELATSNFFNIDAEAANSAIAAWEQSPEAIAVRTERAVREAAALEAANSPEATWERLSGGLDEETILDLAKRTAKNLCRGEVGDLSLDHTTGTARVGATSDQPAFILWWNGDAFELHPERFGPPPVILLTVEDVRALAEANTPEATWRRIAVGWNEATLSELAKRTASELCKGALGDISLDHATGTARVGATSDFNAFTLKWNGAGFEYYRESYGPPPSVLLTVEALRALSSERTDS